ncbi:MAG: putative 7-carboxy-7-deazaguanine synthase QueE [Oscillospiraceae bacterium]|nr:putative 7-carboxy-7-deazaguanine synthase QueE [Oscillospiraceae bacterium]MBQ8012282.1 putative 7-carboxy-7-deazaguanine synthase QueE [Oscillospiraceae bacterium]
MTEFRLAERFVSINGEAAHAGELAVFLRFTGCNLNCSYCDTAWANEENAPYTVYTTQEICDYVQETGVKNVTITGGEPLLQKDLPELLRALHALGIRTEIETNGSQPIAELAKMAERPAFTLDYKCPSSGMEDAMLIKNYLYLMPEDCVKFVVGSREDLERAREVMDEFFLPERCRVYLSPVFGKIDPKEIVEFMQENEMNGVRLQLQLHKIIWHPEERGV